MTLVTKRSCCAIVCFHGIFLSLQDDTLRGGEGFCDVEAKVDDMARAVQEVDVRVLLEDYDQRSLVCFLLSDRRGVRVLLCGLRPQSRTSKEVVWSTLR